MEFRPLKRHWAVPALTAAAFMAVTTLGLRAQRAQVRTTSVHSRPAAKPAPSLSADDISAGDDPVVRAAAVRALGNMNGTAVVVDPNDGRVLTMVNQSLALSADYQPCSTTKMAVALAALDQGLITENTPIQVATHWSINLTYALAHSINSYFERLGQEMGFAKLAEYERELGLGEMAGWDIAGESAGLYPESPGPGGVAKLSSFGEGIYISPLQLAALTAAIANGGTLFYLQHPTSEAEAQNFIPRIKRTLPISALVPQIQDGMLDAVREGTATPAHVRDEEILGKTGTCDRAGEYYGLFASYLDAHNPKLVVVVVLRNRRPVSGAGAAEVAGQIYRGLEQSHYLAALRMTPAELDGILKN